MKIIRLVDGSFVRLGDSEYNHLMINGSVEKEIKVKQSSIDILKSRVFKLIKKNDGITLGKVLNGFRSKRDLVLNIVDELEKDGSIIVRFDLHPTTLNEIKRIFVNKNIKTVIKVD